MPKNKSIDICDVMGDCMKKTWLILGCCLAVCLALGACGPGKPPEEPYGIMTPTKTLYEGLDLLKLPQQAVSSDTDSVEYRVVIDDGSGMLGFTANHCTSYRAAIAAVMDASSRGESLYIPASKLAKGDTTAWNHALLEDVSKPEFFRDKSNSISDVIQAMAKQYQPDNRQVMVFISDLMIPTEAGCVQAANAIRDTFLLPEDTTAGLIGIVGDFRGTIENLPVSPKTGYTRKISDYMVLERDESGVFRHPLYILFLGDDQAVLSAMEKAMTKLSSCGLLDDTNECKALFFSEYGLKQVEERDVSFEFDMGHVDYDAGNDKMAYVMRGVEDDNGSVLYPNSTAIPEEYQLLLSDMRLIRLYADSRGSEKDNVILHCNTPFILTDSSQKGEVITDKHKLFIPASELDLSDKDYSVEPVIRVLDYQEKDGQIKAAWVEPDAALIRCDDQSIQVRNGTIEVDLSVNTGLLESDKPLLISVGVRVHVEPKAEEIEALYDTSWINDWTLNLKAFDREFTRQSESPSSARFTYETTAKTPFLSSLFVGGVADQQIDITRNAIADKTGACAETGMFGIVVRDYPAKYLRNQHWDDKEDFGGWAYSLEDAKEIMMALGKGK